MIKDYVAASGLLFLAFGCIWSHKTWLNTVLKIMFFLYTAWALLILDGRL